MDVQNELPSAYFRRYRQILGFSNQSMAKDFLGAKDYKAPLDLKYANQLTSRIIEIVERINTTLPKGLQNRNLKQFTNKNILHVQKQIVQSGIIGRLNNQGRRPEEVLFSWLRGYAVVQFFSPHLIKLFNINSKGLKSIGDDDFKNIETFKRTPTADLKTTIGEFEFHIEVQSGFQGINDIKEHKVREASKIRSERNIRSLCVHFDLYNGQVAFVQLDTIEDGDFNWVTRQQMEGQSVFAIDQNYFIWRIMDKLPTIEQIGLV